ncbi:MAG: DUF4364 family protein [Oscillospiraceae bacterium]
MSEISKNFIAGIAPGGIKEVYEVKILICYLLHSVEFPLSQQNLGEIFSADEAVDYFTFVTALNELKASGHLYTMIVEEEEQYRLTELGVETALNLQQALPSSLRDKVVKRGMGLLAKMRKNNEISTKIEPCHNGYHVICSIHEGSLEFLSLSLYAPDEGQAEIIAKNFYEKSTEAYQQILKLLSQ